MFFFKKKIQKGVRHSVFEGFSTFFIMLFFEKVVFFGLFLMFFRRRRFDSEIFLEALVFEEFHFFHFQFFSEGLELRQKNALNLPLPKKCRKKSQNKKCALQHPKKRRFQKMVFFRKTQLGLFLYIVCIENDTNLCQKVPISFLQI